MTALPVPHAWAGLAAAFAGAAVAVHDRAGAIGAVEVLLANIAGLYASWHGPDGLRRRRRRHLGHVGALRDLDGDRLEVEVADRGE